MEEWRTVQSPPSSYTEDTEGTSYGLSQKQEYVKSVTARWDAVQELMTPIVIPMQEEISSLKLELRELTKEIEILRGERITLQTIQNLKDQSKKTALELRKMFGLPTTDKENSDLSLSDLQGMFKEYGNNDIDSVELLRTMRDEEN